MQYNIIDLIESDETMSTCQMFNAEVCYGSGLVYDTELATYKCWRKLMTLCWTTTSQVIVKKKWFEN